MRRSLILVSIFALGLLWVAALGRLWSVAMPFGSVPRALAATATGCPGEDEEGGVDEASHVNVSGQDSGSGGEESSDEGGDEDAPPKFTRRFYRHWFSMDASTDGFEAPELPVSIEAVCDLPRKLQKQGDQLSGADGVAVVSSRTRIVKDGVLLTGATRTAELDGADTVSLKVRLFRPKNWREDEDGEKIATFRTRRIVITD
jgi:hypothetical protein